MYLFKTGSFTSNTFSRASTWSTTTPVFRLSVIQIIILFFGVLFYDQSWAQPLNLDAPSEANAGYYQLQWHAQTDARFFQLLEAGESGFIRPRIIYKGPDLASHISGKPDGLYYYRVIAFNDNGEAIAISNDVKITVKHHSLIRAGLFFVLGALVFIATLTIILIGNRSTQS